MAATLGLETQPQIQQATATSIIYLFMHVHSWLVARFSISTHTKVILNMNEK